jgi:16S rRNA (guanine966-N2)-methyltransferase
MIARPQSRRPPGQIRIIGGRWRGRKIALRPGAALRPTPNRVRETLFNWLSPYVAGARCLDLFAGSGALGIEALSRGADSATFVESSTAVARALDTALGRLGASASVICADALEYVHNSADARFDIVFLDPPYELRVDTLVADVEGWLAPKGLVYLERASRDGLPELGWGRWIKRGQAASVRFGLAARP